MKQIILSLVLFFMMSSLFSQEVFKPGIVKGKNVTYKVTEQNTYPWGRIIRNMHNADTNQVKMLDGLALLSQIQDIEMQITEIVRRHLSQEELLKISKIAESSFTALLRIDHDQLVQVDLFLFDANYKDGERKRSNEIPDSVRVKATGVSVGECFVNMPVYRKKEHPEPSEDIWLSLDPDRLYEIEKDIVNQVVLPEKMLEKTLSYVFRIDIYARYICDVEKTRERRKEAIKYWKKDSK